VATAIAAEGGAGPMGEAARRGAQSVWLVWLREQARDAAGFATDAAILTPGVTALRQPAGQKRAAPPNPPRVRALEEHSLAWKERRSDFRRRGHHEPSPGRLRGNELRR